MAKTKAELRVSGLAEPGRVRCVETALAGVQGVEYAHVNLGAGKVTVEFDDAQTGVDTLIKVVREAGFGAVRE